MNQRPAWLPLAALALLLTQCQKSTPAPDQLSLLPPATQTGARTFGCLVNGQAYLPTGRIGVTSNYDINYDPTYLGGTLDIGTYSATAKNRNYLILGGNQVGRVGTYKFGPATTLLTFYTDDARPAPCNDFDSRTAGTFSRGTLTITRLDLQTGIIAGTFDYVLAQPGCDTLRVTQGRFDYRL